MKPLTPLVNYGKVKSLFCRRTEHVEEWHDVQLAEIWKAIAEETVNTSPSCRKQLHISTRRVKINLLNISKCKCAIHWLRDLFSSNCRLRYSSSENFRQITIREKAIALGLAYNEFGYNEYPPTMRRLLCINIVLSNVTKYGGYCSTTSSFLCICLLVLRGTQCGMSSYSLLPSFKK